MLLRLLKGSSLQKKNPKFEAPVVPLNSFLSLLSLAYSEIPKKKKGARGELIATKLKAIYKTVKKLIFSRLVATDIGANAFKLLLNFLTQETDSGVRLELADVAIEMLRYEATSSSSRPILILWQGLVYPSHIEETKFILEHMQQDSRKNQKRWKQVATAPFASFLTKTQNSLQTKKSSSNPEVASLSKVIKSLQSRLPSRKSWTRFLFNIAWNVLIVYFLYYCVVEIACKPCTSNNCPTNAVCPLEHPLAQTAMDHFEHDVKPHLVHTYSQLTPLFHQHVAPLWEKYALPLWEKHVESQWDVYGQPQWKQHVAPVIEKIRGNQVVVEGLKQVPRLIDTLKTGWRAGAEWIVWDVVPGGVNGLLRSVEYFWSTIYPKAITYTEKGYMMIKSTELYQKVAKSEFGKGMGRIVEVWSVGLDFILDATKCGVGLEGSDCDGVQRVWKGIVKSVWDLRQ